MTNLKNYLTVIFVFITCLLYFISPVFSQETAGQLFEKALYEEEANGDLEKAIEIYEKLFKQFPDNRPVAAKALLHIGLCYEKLGQNEAKKAYQQLVNNAIDAQFLAKKRLLAKPINYIKCPLCLINIP